jgi:SAM-dependent methyltransferase
MELLLGCGSNRKKKIYLQGRQEWTQLVTLDCVATHSPDVVHDLESLPLPFPDNSFDEIHAYDVLEHTGRLGDIKFFFDQWSDFWRILKPDGLFFGVSPAKTSPWAWGDPGHTRLVLPEHFAFLQQTQYTKQVGTTPMSDYRSLYKADFDIYSTDVDDVFHKFILIAVKPSRYVEPASNAA